MWEVLYYAAMLRLPRTMIKEQKMERVSTVIKALGIDKCKDTIIGESSALCDRQQQYDKKILYSQGCRYVHLPACHPFMAAWGAQLWQSGVY